MNSVLFYEKEMNEPPIFQYSLDASEHVVGEISYGHLWCNRSQTDSKKYYLLGLPLDFFEKLTQIFKNSYITCSSYEWHSFRSKQIPQETHNLLYCYLIFPFDQTTSFKGSKIEKNTWHVFVFNEPQKDIKEAFSDSSEKMIFQTLLRVRENSCVSERISKSIKSYDQEFPEFLEKLKELTKYEVKTYGRKRIESVIDEVSIAEEYPGKIITLENEYASLEDFITNGKVRDKYVLDYLTFQGFSLREELIQYFPSEISEIILEYLFEVLFFSKDKQVEHNIFYCNYVLIFNSSQEKERSCIVLTY